MQVNVLGMVHVAHVLAPHLVEQKNGTFVFIASVAGQIGSQTDPPYSASKAANINFAQCLAKDLAAHNVRVNTVCPGMVQTALNRGTWQAWHDQSPPEERISYEEWGARKIRSVVPLGKWQTPEAIADMIVFLSSDRAVACHRPDDQRRRRVCDALVGRGRQAANRRVQRRTIHV